MNYNDIKNLNISKRGKKELLNALNKGGGSGAGVTIVDSVDKLDENAPVGSLAAVAVGGEIKETKFSEVFESLPDIPTTEDIAVIEAYINACPIINKVNIVAPRVIPEDAQYIIVFLAGDIEVITGGGEEKVIMIFVTKDGAQGMVQLSQEDQRMISLFTYDATSQTYVLDVQQINDLNTIIASDEFKYAGDLLGSLAGPMEPEDLIVIDSFISLYAGTKSQAQLYIKEEDWVKVAESEVQKIYKELENKVSILRVDNGLTLYIGNIAKPNILYNVYILQEPIIKLDIDTTTIDMQCKEYVFYFNDVDEEDIQFLDKNGIPLEIKWANGNSPIFEDGGNYLVSICTLMDCYLGVFVEFI